MTPSGTALAAREAVDVLRLWGIEVHSDSIRPGSGTANASAIVDLGARRLMLRRRNPRYAREGWARFDHALLAHLAGDGLPVPRCVPGPDGRAWARVGERIYELFGFVEGEAHRVGDPAQVRSAGETLARLHLSAAQFRPPVAKPWPRFHDPKDLPAWLEPLASEAEGERADVLGEALSLARDLGRRLPDGAYRSLPATVVQGDYHPGNLKFRDGLVAGVFDWDWASEQPRMVDVADGLLFFCGRRRGPVVVGDIWSLTEAFTIDEALVADFLAGYSSQLEPTAGELRALPDLMRCRWLYCRADAAQRKVEAERRAEFVSRELRLPLRGIARIEAKLTGAESIK